jgi:hypothetical protein
LIQIKVPDAAFVPERGRSVDDLLLRLQLHFANCFGNR